MLVKTRLWLPSAHHPRNSGHGGKFPVSLIPGVVAGIKHGVSHVHVPEGLLISSSITSLSGRESST